MAKALGLFWGGAELSISLLAHRRPAPATAAMEPPPHQGRITSTSGSTRRRPRARPPPRRPRARRTPLTGPTTQSATWPQASGRTPRSCPPGAPRTWLCPAECFAGACWLRRTLLCCAVLCCTVLRVICSAAHCCTVLCREVLRKQCVQHFCPSRRPLQTVSTALARTRTPPTLRLTAPAAG